MENSLRNIFLDLINFIEWTKILVKQNFSWLNKNEMSTLSEKDEIEISTLSESKDDDMSTSKVIIIMSWKLINIILKS